VGGCGKVGQGDGFVGGVRPGAAVDAVAVVLHGFVGAEAEGGGVLVGYGLGFGVYGYVGGGIVGGPGVGLGRDIAAGIGCPDRQRPGPLRDITDGCAAVLG